jgi:cobalt-zinc-cadmium efflux system outer membrane protein
MNRDRRRSASKRGHLAIAAFAIALSATGCVSEDAGYQDVRNTTAARLHRDVRWDEHDSASATHKETRDLLAHPLDANAAVQVALLNNQGIQAAFEELGVARAGLVQGLRIPNPRVEAALRFTGKTPPDIDLLATLSLTDLLFLPLRNGMANAQMDAAKARVAGSVLDLALEVRVAFYAYQAAVQQLELRKSVLEALGTSFELAKRMNAAGNSTDLSMENERALYEESRISFSRAQSLLVATREELNARMGLGGREASWTAGPRLSDATTVDSSLSDLDNLALEHSLDLEFLRHRYEAEAKLANLSKLRGWIPDLRAGVSAQRQDSDWGIGPAAALELPLFYQGQGETSMALAEMRRAHKLYAETALRVRAAARGTVARLRAAAESAEYCKTVLLPLRQQIVDNTQLEYNAMAVGVFQLLQAKRDQISAAAGYVDLLREYWTLRAEVDQLAAGRLPRSPLGDASDTMPLGSTSVGDTH